MGRLIGLSTITLVLSACIGDLPEAEFPCLVAQDLYNKYNEAYVFSPQGDKKRQAMARIVAVEEDCRAGRVIENGEPAGAGVAPNPA
ncbi:hypothetical protein R0135_08030 [Congregibacter variabilis]|uniref:Lipoprotein n=1 Tax=Congregibacter variabilis TaxID=3081200 RepID=A0ABZ0I6G7_9GAMM|nr:hypothetical protein R0135_08030 [Congregibacter sp. IMCC43200]